MITDNEGSAFISGVALGFLILGVVVTIWGESTTLYQDGYYEAYKQYKQEKLEQSVSKEIKLRYDSEMLKEKYK